MDENTILYVLLFVCVVIVVILSVWTILRESEISRATMGHISTATSLIKSLSGLESQIKELMSSIDKTTYVDEMQSRELRQMLGILETRMLDAIGRLSESVNRMSQFSNGNSIHVNTSSNDSRGNSTFNGPIEGDAKVNAADGTFLDRVVDDR